MKLCDRCKGLEKEPVPEETTKALKELNQHARIKHPVTGDLTPKGRLDLSSNVVMYVDNETVRYLEGLEFNSGKDVHRASLCVACTLEIGSLVFNKAVVLNKAVEVASLVQEG